MYDIQQVKAKLDELGVRANKKLGQNFLINTEICGRICEQVKNLNPKEIVEIGPGLGALTLLLRSSGIPLKLIELDQTFFQYWKDQNLNVVCADAILLNWGDLSLQPGTMLVSNLPFQISSTLLIDRSIEYCGIDYMILMFQKEVGQRIIAKKNTKDYGLLSVIAQTFWILDKLFDVGPKDFYPPPQVASRVIKFKRKGPGLQNPVQFLNFVKIAFQHRRKFLIKNIVNFKNVDFEKTFSKLDFSTKARAEDLSPEEFVLLYNEIV